MKKSYYINYQRFLKFFMLVLSITKQYFNMKLHRKQYKKAQKTHQVCFF